MSEQDDATDVSLAADGKADGSAIREFDLNTDVPSQTYRITCNEFFSCDLNVNVQTSDLSESVGAALGFVSDGTEVQVTRESDGRAFLTKATIFHCLDNGSSTRRGMFNPNFNPPSSISCKQLEAADLSQQVYHSDEPNDRFIINVRHNVWTNSDSGHVSLQMRWK